MPPAQPSPQQLRKAIEDLIDAKLLDLVAKPGGLASGVDRLLAHRRSGVASFDIRLAERKLDELLDQLVGPFAGLPQERRAQQVG